MLKMFKKFIVLMLTFSLIFANQSFIVFADSENDNAKVVVEYDDDKDIQEEEIVDLSDNDFIVNNNETEINNEQDSVDNNDNIDVEDIDLNDKEELEYDIVSTMSEADDVNDDEDYNVTFGTSVEHILDYNWIKKTGMDQYSNRFSYTQLEIIKGTAIPHGTKIALDDNGLNAFMDKDNKKITIVIPENDVLKLGNSIKIDDYCYGTFHKLEAMKSITGLNLLDTSDTTDMSSLFSKCVQLESLDLSSWNTSKVKTMSEMFGYNKKLKQLNLSNFDTHNVESFCRMFYQCESIESLDLSNFDTSSVIEFSSMFFDCKKLSYLNILNFDTQKANAMSLMFANCNSLTTLNVSSFKTDNVYDMSQMFQGCSRLKSLDLSSFNTSKVGLNGDTNGFFGMFTSCSSLETLDVSNFDTKNAKYMGCMFKLCSNLVELDLSSFNTVSVLDATEMFSKCSKLKTIYATNSFNVTKHEDGDHMFSEATCLVGGNGTAYSSDKISMTYGRVDEPGKPGYFTLKQEPTVSTTHILDYNWILKTRMKPIRENYDIYNKYTQIELKKGTEIPSGNKIALDDKGLYAYMDETNGKITILIPEGDVLKLGNAIKNEYDNPVGAFGDLKFIKSISGLNLLDTSETTDMSGLFSECRQIESLDITNFDTSNVQSMYRMFYANVKLKEVDLRNFDTHNVENFASMFYWTGLEELDLSNFNTSKATDMSCMFYGAEQLKKINLSSFDTSNVVNFNTMFNECKSIKTLDLSNFNTKNAKYMYGMFRKCSSLTSIDLSSFDTSNVLQMGEMFANCSSLKSLDLSNFNTSKVGYGYNEEVGDFWGMFHYCISLTTLDISNFDTRNAKCMGHMFNICSSLVELDLSSFDTPSLLDASEMFNKCTNLKTIYATNKFRVTKEIDGDYMFNKATSLVGQNGTTYSEDRRSMIYARVDEPGKPGYFTLKKEPPVSTTHILDYNWVLNTVLNNDSLYRRVKAIDIIKSNDTQEGTPFNIDNKGLKGYINYDSGKVIIVIPKNDVLKLGNPVRRDSRLCGAFYGFDYVRNITGLDLIDTSDATDLSYLFFDCQWLSTVDLSSWDTSKVTTMFGMFERCSGLENLDLSNFNTSNVECFQEMFYQCSKLTSLDLSNFDTKNATNFSRMFHNCSKLTNLDLSSFDTKKATDMSFMFYYCSSLQSLNSIIKNFDTSNVENMASMFSYCKAITTIDLSHFNTKNVKKMSGLFSNCTNLTSFDISSFDTNNVETMNGMFSHCSKLISIDLSHFNTSKVGLGSEGSGFYNMFLACKSLENVNITSFDTKNVGYMTKMFQGCTNIETLDLSSFETPNLIDATEMFYGCTKLKTIYATNKLVIANNPEGDGMFLKAVSLVGGNGTTYSEDKTTRIYARVDEPGKPGYFTLKKEPIIEPTSSEQPTSKEEPTSTEESSSKEETSSIIESSSNEETTSKEEATTKETIATQSTTTETVAPTESSKPSTNTGSHNNGSSGSSGGSGGGDGVTPPSQQTNTINDKIASNASKITKQDNVVINTSLYGTAAAMSRDALNGVQISIEGDKTLFKDKQGNLLKGMQKIKINNQEGYYFFNYDNKLAMGFMKDENNNVHYFDGNGQMVVNRTVQIGNLTYEVNANGEINQTNLDKQAKDLLFDNCETNVYSGENVFNQQTNSWSTFIVNPHTGQKELAKGLVQLVQEDGINTYYFSPEGNLVTGYVYVDGKIRYFDPKGGKLIETK